MIDIKNKKEMYQSLFRRYEIARTFNIRFLQQLLDCVYLVAPNNNAINLLYSYDNSGSYIQRYISNSIAMISSQKRASDLHSLLLPMGRRWVEIYEDDIYSDKASEKVYKILQNSNLHRIAPTLFQDINIGCGGLWIDTYSKDEPLVFKSVYGTALVPEYNNELAPVSAWFNEPKESSDSSDIQEYYTNGFILNRCEDDKPIYKVDNCEEYKWLYVKFDSNTEDILVCEARKYKQLHMFNDTIRAGESRGRGVIMSMLNDITYLNKLDNSIKKTVAMQAEPPILTNLEEFGNTQFDNLIGSILPSTLSRDGSAGLKPMTWEVDLNAAMAIRKDLEVKIQMAFNVENLGQVNDTPVRTATETQARVSEAERESLTDISQLLLSFKDLMDTCLDILKDKGILTKKHKITFVDPTLQDENNTRLNNLLTYKQAMSQLVSPNYTTMVNNPNAIDSLVKSLLNIPTDLELPQQQRQALMQNIQQMLHQNPQQQEASQSPQAINTSQTDLASGVSQAGYGV